MEQTILTPKQLRHRRFLAVLPVLVLPFITFLFWSLGGGKPDPAKAQADPTGLNMQLPRAHLDERKSLDKLSYYEQAETDSEKLIRHSKRDPFNNQEVLPDSSSSLTPDSLLNLPDIGHGREAQSRLKGGYRDPNEEKVYRKLDELSAALEQSSTAAAPSDRQAAPFPTSTGDQADTKLQQLQAMMQTMDGKDSDAEMQQLNGMLEKILDIQHPELAREKIRQASAANRGQVYSVGNVVPNTPVSLLEAGNTTNALLDSISANRALPVNRFYSLDDIPGPGPKEVAVSAVIHETQTLVTGSTVKLRLTEPVYINGTEVPKEGFVYGLASLNGERLSVKISSIRFHNAVLPVELAVFDMDGVDGIYIPGAIARDVAKQSADRAVQSVGLTTLNPSLEVQAASAGIEAAKTLFSKKVRLIKVTVKAGYQVLLRDDKQAKNN